MEGYEGMEALSEGGGAPQRRLYSRGAPLKPALVVLEGGGWRVECGEVELYIFTDGL